MSALKMDLLSGLRAPVAMTPASALNQAMDFTYLVERFVRSADCEDAGLSVPTEAELAEALYAVRACIAEVAEGQQQIERTPDLSTMAGQADAHLRALLRYTEGFYSTAISYGMKAGPTANAVAHVERAGKALHQLVHAMDKILSAEVARNAQGAAHEGAKAPSRPVDGGRA